MSTISFRLGCIKPPHSHADKSGEYLLFDRTGAVQGLRIQQRVKHSNGHGDTYQDAYHFDVEPAIHIKEFLLCNGKGTRHEDQARLIDYTQSNRWIYNNGGERIRIVNSGGTVLAEFDIPANTCTALPLAPAKIILPVAGAAAVGAFGEPS